MRNIVYLAIWSITLFCSCHKDELVEDKAKTELWKPLLTSVQYDNYLEIKWDNPVVFEKVIRPFTYIDPDRFEIYLSKNDREHFERVAALENDKANKYQVKNLVNGQYYFLAVKAIKKGKIPLMSDTIMVIPFAPNKVQRVIENNDFPIETGSLSKDRQVVAYMNRSFTWDNGKFGQMSLFSFNLISRQNSIIDTAAYFPDWSPSEMKIVYCSDKHEVNKGYGFPQQLLIYDYQNQKIKKLTQGEYFNTNPDFSHDGNWIAYSSDEGHHGTFELWKIATDGSLKVKITENLKLTGTSIGNFALGKPSWSSDDQFIYFNNVENGNSKNGIYRVSVQNKTIEPVIVSRWIDACPVVSPDNKKIAFYSNRSGSSQIWIYNLLTKRYTQITGYAGENADPNWGKTEWLNDKTLQVGGYSPDNSIATLFTVDLNLH